MPGPRTRAPAHPILDELGRVRRFGPGRAHQARGVGADVPADGRLADEMLEIDQRLGGQHAVDGLRGVLRRFPMMMRSSSSALG